MAVIPPATPELPLPELLLTVAFNFADVDAVNEFLNLASLQIAELEIATPLDANGNGKISADEIELDLVSAEILVIFKPLLVEMETFNEDLDKEEFIESGMTLLEKLDIN